MRLDSAHPIYSERNGRMGDFHRILTLGAVVASLSLGGTAALADNAATAVASPSPTTAADEGQNLAKEELEKLFGPGTVIKYTEGHPGDIMQIRLNKGGQAEADYTSAHRGQQTMPGTWRVNDEGTFCRTFLPNHDGHEVCSSISSFGNSFGERRVGGRRFVVDQSKGAASAAK